MVTVAIVMLSLAGLSFVANMSTEHKVVRVQGDELQLAYLVDSGAELLSVFLEQPAAARTAAGGLADNPELWRAMLVFKDQRSGQQGRFSVLSPKVENDEVVGIRFGAENESARLNLAVLMDWERQQPGAARQALLGLPGMTEAIADAILDWIDADSTRRPYGAEREHYAGLRLPYAPRNATPATVEELLLVRGVTRELLLGADANRDYQVEPAEVRSTGSQGGRFRSGAGLAWTSLLTVHSAERNIRPDGRPRIDLSDANLPQLQQRLSETLSEPQVRFIVWHRQFGPYQGGGSAGEEPPPAVDLSLPARFPIASVLDLIGARVQVPGQSGQQPRIAQSPFTNDLAAMREYLPRLLDSTTVDATKVIRGRINVNEAPRAVLRAVPGMDGTLVEQIAASRGARIGVEDPNRRHPTWLLTEGLVDLTRMKALLPFLTAGGDVYRAQVVGYFDEGGPTKRVELAIDATADPPGRVYWKDVRLLGRGFSPEILGGSN